MMSGAAGFHDDQVHLSVGKPAFELAARHAMGLDHLPRGIGHRKLENGLGQINGDGSSIHVGLLLSWFAPAHHRLERGTMMPGKRWEESIPSLLHECRKDGICRNDDFCT